MREDRLGTLVEIYELLKKDHLGRLLQDSNVTGIDIGFKVRENLIISGGHPSGKGERLPQLALRLHVAEKSPAKRTFYFDNYYNLSESSEMAEEDEQAKVNYFYRFIQDICREAKLDIGDLSVEEHSENTPGELDVIEMNPIQKSRSARGKPNRVRSTTVIQPGLSIGHTHRASGTLGSIVFEQGDARPLLLSCWHVLAHSGSKNDERILHPGPSDGGKEECDWIASLIKKSTEKEDPPTKEPWRHSFLPDIRGDAAVARLLDKPFLNQWVYRGQLGKQGQDSTPVVISQVYSLTTKGISRKYALSRDDFGREVWKSGKATGVTKGRIDGIGIYFFDYAGIGRVAVEGFKIVPTDDNHGDEISLPGDSGAIWVAKDGKDFKGVGLHMDGEKNRAFKEEHAIACHLDKVLAKLNVSLEQEAADP